MKVLVLGANGMAGHAISLYFLQQGHDVKTITRTPFKIGENINLDINLNSLAQVSEIISTNEFDAIINCVGVLNQFAERDKEKAVFLNSYLPHYLSEQTMNLRTKIIHMSTDCVFSGIKGSYKEDVFPDGTTFYDRSKALGELNDSKNLTFRNSIIGPDININGIGLFNWFMKQDDSLEGYEKVLWSGVTTLTLAKAMEEAIKQNLTGIYHLVNNEKINKYQLLKLFNKYFKNNELSILPQDKIRVDKSLIDTRNDFEFKVPSYEEMIYEMREWIKNNSIYYPHYQD